VLSAERGRTRHHVLRIDREPDGPPPAEVRARIVSRLRSLEAELDALLLSDYGYGLLGEELAQAARSLRVKGATVVLDPRRTFDPFHGLTALTPNLGELALAARCEPEVLAEPAEFARTAEGLLRRSGAEYLLVTLGNRGMSLFTRDGSAPSTVPATGTDALDVSGAGDTAAAAFTLALAAGLDGAAAMRLANAAAGVVVMEPGAAACGLDKLRSVLSSSPLPSRNASARSR
jgi:rfaE bifunctional protein kinase chain/domain